MRTEPVLCHLCNCGAESSAWHTKVELLSQVAQLARSNKYLVSTCYMPDTRVGAGGQGETRQNRTLSLEPEVGVRQREIQVFKQKADCLTAVEPGLESDCHAF